MESKITMQPNIVYDEAVTEFEIQRSDGTEFYFSISESQSYGMYDRTYTVSIGEELYHETDIPTEYKSYCESVIEYYMENEHLFGEGDLIDENDLNLIWKNKNE